VAIPEIDVDELARRLEAGAELVDVREADEYEQGHIPSAQLVPLSELTERVDELPEAPPLLLVCRSGARSMRAAEYLAGLGFEAVNVAGGTLAWIASGRDVVAGPAPA
jgi:rhodanese-related sulfurtransferase